jgi:hypothetical protein
MGACCGTRPYFTDNDGENFIRDCIQTLKIRTYKFQAIHAGYLDVETIEKKEIGTKIQEIHTLEEEKYERFLKKYYYTDDNSNAYSRFHVNLVPYYKELWDKERPQFSFYSHVFSLLAEKNKYNIVEDVLKPYYQQLNFNLFEVFLPYYLEINLVGFTRKINNTLKDLRETLVIDTHVVDANLKKSVTELTEKVFTQDNVNKLGNLILEKFTAILAAAKIDKTHKIDAKYFLELNNSYPWLFDALELRSYFYDNIHAIRAMK